LTYLSEQSWQFYGVVIAGLAVAGFALLRRRRRIDGRGSNSALLSMVLNNMTQGVV